MLAYLLTIPAAVLADESMGDAAAGASGFIVLATIVVAVYVILYLRATPRAVRQPPEYLHEPPADLPPALVGMLYDVTVTPDKMAATVLDLVRRGVITMTKPGELTSQDTRPGDDDRWLTLHRDRMTGLQQFEQELIYEVFDHIARGDRVRSGDLRAWWHDHPTTSGAIEAIWSVRLQQAMMSRGLLDPKSLKARQMLTFYGVGVVFGIMLAGVLGVWAVLFFALGVVLVVWSQRLTGVSQRGAELLVQYESFRHYLADFGRFQEQPAEAVVIWEQYLPLAIALSLGDKAEREVSVGAPLFDREPRVGDPFPDEVEGMAYMGFRRAYDPALPVMRVVRGKSPGLRFTGSVQTAMTVTGPMGKMTLSVRRRPVTALLAVSPFIIFPVAMVLLVVLVGGQG